MNLDMVISRELKRSPMENALHGVVESLGAEYQLKALPVTITKVEEMFGMNLGTYTTGGVSRPSYEEKTKKPISHYADVVDGYTLVYEAATGKWGLYNGVVKEEPSMLGKVARFLRGESTTPPMPPIEIIKYGEGSGHRFLSALETEDDIPHETKLAIANRVVAVISGDASISNLQQGQTMVDNSGLSMIDIAGTTPVGSTTMTNGAMEMNLAEEYGGVKKQRNSTFMGDTLIPTPISNAQVQQHSSALSFNQNTAGIINRPPTKVPLNGKFTKTSRSF